MILIPVTQPPQDDGIYRIFLWLVAVISAVFFVYLTSKYSSVLRRFFKALVMDDHDEETERRPVAPSGTRVSTPEKINPSKPKSPGLSLGDLNPGHTPPPGETPANTLPGSTTKVNQGSATPSPATATPTPADFEKSIEQSMQGLINQAKELTRQFKLAEKATTDLKTSYNASTNTLNAEIERKNEQIGRLESLLTPSLRAMIEVRKLCEEMLSTQKPMEHDALVNFITGKIDDKLFELDIKTEEFIPGTPLEKIPGDRVENSPHHELTEETTKVNQVAKSIRPCYYLERDSKRIIIAKAVVVLYQLKPPPAPESTNLTTPPSA
jgi:hypothetical protein